MRSNIETMWNDETIAKLKAGLEAGDGFGTIAKELGCSRNAIAGKIYRLGLRTNNPSCRPSPGRPRKEKPLISDKFSPRAAAIVRGRSHKARPTTRAERIIHKQECDAENPPIQPEIQMEPIQAITPSTRKKLMQLVEDSCRWPFGTPGHNDFFFCGSPTADMARGQPYCPEHADHAYRSR